MPFPFAFRRPSALLPAALLAVLAVVPAPSAAQDGDLSAKPFVENEWTYGRRLDESVLRYCVDARDPDWEVAATIADAIAAGLLLEPQRHVVDSDLVLEDITRLYEVMLANCDVHMGFKLIPGGYPNWAILSRPYYDARYVYVAADPALHALSDLDPSRAIGATLGTSAHMRLVAYLTALPREDRWPTYPMGTNDRALAALLDGTVDVAVVWGPSYWAKRQADPALAGLHEIDPSPLPATTLGVGALLLADETFLRTALDEAIAALRADGTIAGILDDFDFPATAEP